MPLLAILVLLTLAGTVRAQTIVWQTPQAYTGSASDISTLGMFKSAVMENSTASSVTSGDTIFDSIDSSHISGPGAGGGDGSGSIATTYLQALDGCTYVNVSPPDSPLGVSQVSTFSLTGLTSGEFYQVQVWNVTTTGRRETELSGFQPAYLPGDDFVLGTFAAPASGTETFTFQGLPGGEYGEVDAVALRDEGVPEPSTYAMMLGGLAVLGFCVRRRLA